MTDAFRPPFYLKGAFIQTMLASSSIRKWGNNPMSDAAEEMILDCGDSIRLQGYYSARNGQPVKGLVVLLTGWEGSSNSAYILSTGKYLYRNGYEIFRLNFRDHGESHHLNEGLFYATLLDEVFEAVRGIAEGDRHLPLFLAGFSMGANFALRIARKCSETPIDHLRHVISISPVLDPEKSTRDIDRISYIKSYFMKKWRRSLLKKQAAFPDIYDFTDVLSLNSLGAITDVLIERYSDYENASAYFKSYSLLGNALMDIAVPTTIIVAEDDPIIPVDDFKALQLNHLTHLIIHSHGGHNGFIETLTGQAWYEKKMVRIFDNNTGSD